jgi:uncharacterized protein YhfF
LDYSGRLIFHLLSAFGGSQEKLANNIAQLIIEGKKYLGNAALRIAKIPSVNFRFRKITFVVKG